MRAAAFAILIGVLLCSAGVSAARKPATIRIAIEGMKFSPASVTVKQGDTVVWTNNDIVAHTVTSSAGAFDSKVIPPGATFKYVARRKGDFGYVCTLHPPMAADVKVR